MGVDIADDYRLRRTQRKRQSGDGIMDTALKLPRKEYSPSNIKRNFGGDDDDEDYSQGQAEVISKKPIKVLIEYNRKKN